MLRIDTERLDLAEEFRGAPMGPHSPELRRLLALLRNGPMAGRPVLVATETGSWAVGTLPGRRGLPIETESESYEDIEVATWELFRHRWKWVTGETLEL